MQTTLQTRRSGLKAASGLRGAAAAEGTGSIPASRGHGDVTPIYLQGTFHDATRSFTANMKKKAKESGYYGPV